MLKIIYQVKGKRIQEISLPKISKIIKTVNSNKELIKVTTKVDNNLFIFTYMQNIDLNEFADILHNKMKKINDDILEEIEYKEW